MVVGSIEVVALSDAVRQLGEHYPGDGVGRIARRDGRVVWVAGG